MSEQISDDQLARLHDVMAAAMALPYYQASFGSEGPMPLESLEDLARLPILRKHDLLDLQPASPPFGGLMAAHSRPDYLFVSPGPIHEPGFLKPAYWRTARALEAAGFTAEDIVHNAFSYHLTPGAWILDAGARALGCTVIPAGTAPIEQQITAMRQYRPSGYTGTPDFLKSLIDAYVAAHDSADHERAVSSVTAQPFSKALVSGGALTPGLRSFFADSGIHALQCYATAELGLIAFETKPDGTMMVDQDMIVEIVDPATGQLMAPGVVGEVVVTTLREDYPLIRFGTGDLSSLIDGPADGRAGPMLSGWLGRADQTAKVRGMFVRPNQISSLSERIDGLHRVQLVIERREEKDIATLRCELDEGVVGKEREAMEQDIARLFRDICQFSATIDVVAADTLASTAPWIDDRR